MLDKRCPVAAYTGKDGRSPAAIVYKTAICSFKPSGGKGMQVVISPRSNWVAPRVTVWRLYMRKRHLIECFFSIKSNIIDGAFYDLKNTPKYLGIFASFLLSLGCDEMST